MNIGKLLGAALGGGAVMWLLGGAWHMMIMGTFYGKNSASVPLEEPLMHWIILGYVILGLLMAYIYPKGFAGGGSVGEGLRFGAIVGLLWVLPHAVILHGVYYGATGKLILIDAAWHVVEQGVGGIVIALIYGSSAAGQSAGAESAG